MNTRISLALLVILNGSLLFAEDWPTLSGPHHNWTTNDKGLADTWPKEGPKLLWENKEINGGFGSPVVAGGRVFVIDHPVDLTVKDKRGSNSKFDELKFLPGPDVLKCLDRTNGKLIWKHEFNPNPDTKPAGWNTPTVEGDVVYARGGDGQIRAISVKDGKSLWVWPKEGEKPYAKDNRKIGVTGGASSAASVTIVDDLVIVLGGHAGY